MAKATEKTALPANATPIERFQRAVEDLAEAKAKVAQRDKDIEYYRKAKDRAVVEQEMAQKAFNEAVALISPATQAPPAKK